MLNGYIKKIDNQKENDWGRYTIEYNGQKILAVGVIPNASVGMQVTLEGEIVNNHLYGRQYKISSVLKTEADKYAGIRTFLAGGYLKNVGLTKANEIIKMFGADALSLFDTLEGLQKLTEVKGLGEASVKKIIPSYEENKKYKDIVLFLNGVGTKLQVEKIYEKYGDKAVKMLKKNPYILQMDLNGFGFKKTDAIALASGVKKDSEYRIMAAIKEVLEVAQTNGGHCYLTMENIEKNVIDLLVPIPKFEDITEKVAENVLETWPEKRENLIDKYNPSAQTLEELATTFETRRVIKDTLFKALSMAIDEEYLINDGGNIYTKQMYDIECNVANMLIKMNKQKPVRFIKPETIETSIKYVEQRKSKDLEKNGIFADFEITKEQRDAVYLGLLNRIAIISGGPGRGKTAISEIIVHAFLSSGKYFSEDDVLMLAPTGKAARRITESTGYKAMTVHRAVMAVRSKSDLPKEKLVIIDEWSMADIYLANNVLKYAKDCNIIFVGDVDQIASVGPGKVLRDMIDSKIIPCILLKEGHRNTGTIAKNSELINSGYKINNYTLDEHFVRKDFIDTSHSEFVNGQENIIIDEKATLKMQKSIIEDYVHNVNTYGIQNVMLCVAMKERGDCCVNRLNQLLQNRFTQGRKAADFGSGKVFRVGDRVMQTANNYSFKKLTPEKTVIDGVFNGEIGIVADIKDDPENDSYKLIVQFDDGTIGGYTKNTINSLVLAYAITIHKCQGSEAKCVMMVYTYADYMLLNRSLFYTGETRAKNIFIMYGEVQYRYGKKLSAFDIAVNKIDDCQRNTMLKSRLIEFAKENS